MPKCSFISSVLSFRIWVRVFFVGLNLTFALSRGNESGWRRRGGRTEEWGCSVGNFFFNILFNPS